MSVFAKLTSDTVASGREHPFTAALMRDLKERHVDALRILVGCAAAGEQRGVLSALGGRAAELERIIDEIERAEGNDE